MCRAVDLIRRNLFSSGENFHFILYFSDENSLERQQQLRFMGRFTLLPRLWHRADLNKSFLWNESLRKTHEDNFSIYINFSWNSLKGCSRRMSFCTCAESNRVAFERMNRKWELQRAIKSEADSKTLGSSSSKVVRLSRLCWLKTISTLWLFVALVVVAVS